MSDPLAAAVETGLRKYFGPAFSDEVFANARRYVCNEIAAAAADPVPVVDDQINPEWWKRHHQEVES